MKKLTLTITGMVLTAGAAQAQPAADEAIGPPTPAERAVPAEPAEPATPADPTSDEPAVAATRAVPATPAEPAATADVSDADVDSFAKVTVELQAIQADTSIAADQKQVKMQAVVTEAGLDPARYNAIGKAAQADQALRTRIQTAMAKHAGHTDG